jgi:thiamine pyrophosphate-dependent acetolactate synthase large subunit-like protein
MEIDERIERKKHQAREMRPIIIIIITNQNYEQQRQQKNNRRETKRFQKK